jgi:molecular chaperone DnaK (HSP70)
VFEGERKLTKDCILLGQFNLEGIAPKPRGVPKITITFSLSSDGILSVSAVDEESGNKKDITVKNEARFSTAEIQRMVEEARSMEESDKVVVEQIQAKNALEAMVYAIKNDLPQLESQGNNVRELEKRVLETISWIDANPSATKEEFDHKRAELDQMIRSAGAQQTPAPAAASRPTVQEVD